MSVRHSIARLLLGPVDEHEVEIYVEQVHYLFGNVGLMLMGSVGVLLTDLIAYHITGDPLFVWLAGALVTMALIRTVLLLSYDRNLKSLPSLQADAKGRVAAMRRWEILYALTTMVFSGLIGLMCYEGMVQSQADLHVYIAFFTSIFAGNIAIRQANRTRIVVWQVTFIMAPFTLGVVMGPVPNYWWLLAMIPMQVFSIRSTTSIIHSMLVRALKSALLSRVLAEQLEAALDNMSNGLCMADADGAVLVMNKRFKEVLGLEADALSVGANLRGAIEAAGVPHVAGMLSGSSPEASRVLEFDGGRIVEVRVRTTLAGGHLVVAEDVTERETAARRIARMAHFDELTGLPNRSLFRSELEERMRTDEPFALLCLDLDQFKEVNDTLGHPMGDRLLVEVAQRLRGMVRGGDFVARLGGDEFMVIVGMGRDEDSVGFLAERMVQRISAPYRIREHDITVGLSVGIAFSAVHGDGPDDLVKNADMALYKSKRDGRGRYCVFRPEMDAEAQKRRQLEIDIRQAIHDNAFTVAYQPIVEVETGKVKCCEALVRWLNNGVNVFPSDFIPVAEETGMIVDIGGIVLRKACAEAMRWPGETMVAVNVSDVQFRRNVVVGQVVEALRLSGLPARRLELEITESLAMENLDHTLAVLSELRRMGVRIALDDFGTGHTALSYLDKIPHDKVKIDRAFIGEIVSKESKRKIVQFVASYNPDVDVVAEGVEDEEQIEALRTLKVPLVQGYFYSKPKPGDEILQFLANPPKGRARLRVVGGAA